MWLFRRPSLRLWNFYSTETLRGQGLPFKPTAPLAAWHIENKVSSFWSILGWFWRQMIISVLFGTVCLGYRQLVGNFGLMIFLGFSLSPMAFQGVVKAVSKRKTCTGWSCVGTMRNPSNTSTGWGSTVIIWTAPSHLFTSLKWLTHFSS